jgi:hypothetical protein
VARRQDKCHGQLQATHSPGFHQKNLLIAINNQITPFFDSELKKHGEIKKRSSIPDGLTPPILK